MAAAVGSYSGRASPAASASARRALVYVTFLRNGVRRRATPSSSILGRPVSASRTTTSIGSSSSSVRSNSPASVRRGGVSGTSGWVRAAAVTSPSTSTSSPPREPMCSTRPRTCAGQDSALGQRRSTSPSFIGRSGVPHSGHRSGMTKSSRG